MRMTAKTRNVSVVFGANTKASTTTARAAYRSESTLFIHQRVAQPEAKLPAMLKSLISESDQPATAGGSPQSAATFGLSYVWRFFAATALRRERSPRCSPAGLPHTDSISSTIRAGNTFLPESERSSISRVSARQTRTA
jgi:hypothetical protein